MSKDIFDSIDQAIEINEKLSSENSRLTMALQDIREHEHEDHSHTSPYDNFDKVIAIAKKALSNDVSIEHEGHLYTFGETTVEVEYLGDVNPFERVKGEK